MARDQIEVDLLLNAKKAEATIKQMNRELSKMGKTMGQAFSGGGGGAGNKVRALGTGLSKATVRADEFSKSLEASNARVIAFGASAGLIMNVDRALRAMVKTTIQVEKAMADVNVVMNVSSKQLDQFGKGMFKVAKETAQGFSTVAEASTELARQGLGMEKTLARTKDALILTRLTGMNAADAVKSLTAAVNSFTKEGVTSAQVINRMAKVDAAFAVSSEDLAKAISRVGSSAVDAGVSMNELMAITTAVQQKTARGGAVIGNAFKTIFTRIQRSDVQSKLKGFGVATEDMSGKMLNGIQVIENLAKKFDTLTKSQQASLGESVAGVFQINILKAAMSDLATETSQYKRALDTANSATNEAYQRNQQLNKTLDSLANRTLANLTQVGAALGGDIFGPAIQNVLGVVNTAVESFGKGGSMEGFGQTIGKGLITGIGKFIGGPGLVIATAVFGKLALSLGKFATTAFKDIMGINNAVKQRVALEEIVVNTLASEPALLQKVKMGTLSVLDVEKQILATIKQQQAERAALKGYGGALAGSMYQRGTRVGSSGRAFTRGMGRASGFVPNFANANGERAAAAAGGYTAGAIKTMNQPGAGTMMYNSAETVKQFPGMSQKAIMPPKNSPAGAGYKSAFGAAHGFDPYAAEGFIPNFNVKKGGSKKPEPRGKTHQFDASRLGVLGIEGSHSGNTSTKFGQLADYKDASPAVRNQAVEFKNIQIRTINQTRREKRAEKGLGEFSVQSFSDEISQVMLNPIADLARDIFEKAMGNNWDLGIAQIRKHFGGKKQLLPPGAEGSIFEAAVNVGLKASKDLGNTFDQTPGSANKPFDFEETGPATPDFKSFFGYENNLTYADAKRTINKENVRSIIKKAYNQDVPDLPTPRGFKKGKKGNKKALGYVPNFSPLSSSIVRERQAGIPASKIRVGSSPALRSSGNPSGLGVYNTIDEPRGLNQGISRSKSMGINPKSHGAAEGFVPNFMVRSSILNQPRPLGPYRPAGSGKSKKTEKADLDTAKNTSKMAQIMEKHGNAISMGGFMAYTAVTGAAAGASPKVGAAANTLSNMGMMAGMGASAGSIIPGLGTGVGAGVGALIGLATSFNDVGVLLDDGSERLRESLGKTVTILNSNLDQISDSLSKLANYDTMTPKERIAEIAKLENKRRETLDELEKASKETEDPIFKNMAKVMKQNLPNPSTLLSGGVPDPESLGKMQQKLQLFAIEKEQAAIFAAATKGGKGFSDMTYKLSATGSAGPGARPSQSQLEKLDKFSPGNTKKSQDLMRNILGPDVIAEMLSKEGGLDELKKISEMSEAKRVVGFNLLLKKSGFTGLGKGFGDMYAGGNRSIQNSMKASYGNMFAEGGVFSSQMMDAFTPRTPRGPMEGAPVPTGMSFGDSQRATYIASQKAGVDLRDSAARLTTGMGNLNRKGAAANLDNRLKVAMKSATLFGEELIKAKGNLEQDRILKEQKLALDKAALVQEEEIAKLTAGAKKTFLDNLLKAEDIGTPEKEAVKKQLQQLQGDPLLEQMAINQGYKTSGEMTRARLETAENLSSQDKLLLSYLRTQIDGEANARAKGTTSIKEATSAYDASTTAAEKNTKSLTDLFNESKKFQYAQKAGRLKFDANVAGATPEGLRRMQQGTAPGYEGERFGITNREIADASREARMKSFRAGEGGMNSMATFKETFAYGENDAILEFDDGVRTVAENMKSSFADAFQSISSGATTVQGALANMAQSILSSINQMSTQMFTNMMFSKMFGGNSPGNFAKGGYVPGYATGGLVTGGSGHKDDVLTRMQGGEFVIKKSAVNKIGVSNLNAINGYANGGSTGPSMGRMGTIAAVSGAATGILGAMMQDRPDKPLPSRNYGKGRGSLGYLGGADPDSGQIDRASGGGTSANVSLSKGFVYYRRDPKTGQLISERARPTEGRFEVSNALSLMGRLDENDSRTSRMFDKEQKLADYQNYVAGEKASRRAQIRAVKDQKKSRLIGAYMNAAMLIGGAKFAGGGPPAGTKVMTGSDGKLSSFAPDAYNPTFTGSEGFGGFKSSVSRIKDPFLNAGVSMNASGIPNMASGGRANGSLARVMGGEYVMSPETVRTHGVGFMTELNRGNLPKYASGGLVGNQTGGVASDGSGAGTAGNMTNNVSINVNIDKSGKAEASASVGSEENSESSREESQDVQNNTGLGKALQSVVLDEIVKQQRPGGLLYTQR